MVSDPFPQNSPLLLALRAFEKAISHDENESILLEVSLHSLQVISRMLRSAWDRPGAASHLIVSTLGRVLHHIMTTLLLSRVVLQTVDVAEFSFVDKIFDCWIDDIFGAVIRAFRDVSSNLMSNLLGDTSLGVRRGNSEAKPPHVVDSIDVRPDLLRLFRTLVDGVGLRVDSTRTRLGIRLSSLRGSLMLKVVGELERVLFSTSCGGDDVDVSECPYQGMKRRLAAKDTVWYLCGLMHILAEGVDTFTGKENGGTWYLDHVHDKILSGLYDLVLKCQGGDLNYCYQDEEEVSEIVRHDDPGCQRGLPWPIAKAGSIGERSDC